MTTSKERKAIAEKQRAEIHKKASEDWATLTYGEWPEEEHQQRFEALLTKLASAPPKIRK